MRSRIFVIGIAVLAAIIVGVGIRLLLPSILGPDRGGTGTALVGGPFELVDQNGNVRKDSDFRGRYMLVYFGYNYCPDVCPTTLSNITTAMESLDAETASRIQPIYITVDPERDSVANMKTYASNFYPGLVALTGTPDQIASAARAYRVYYKKNGDGDDYLVDHSSFIYLIGPDGSYLRHFSHDANPDEIATALADLPSP
jgi:cytochrome oxidase Cu insertion factor (SCO1/SenC/PrrC family)